MIDRKKGTSMKGQNELCVCGECCDCDNPCDCRISCD